MRRYKIITGMYHDNEDNDHIGTQVEYQWFDGEPTPADFPGWDFDHEVGGPLIMLSKFDTEYDRTAEEYFPVVYTGMVELDVDTAEEDW